MHTSYGDPLHEMERMLILVLVLHDVDSQYLENGIRGCSSKSMYHSKFSRREEEERDIK